MINNKSENYSVDDKMVEQESVEGMECKDTLDDAMNRNKELRSGLNTKERLTEFVNLFGDTYNQLAMYLDITYQSLNKKLNNHVDFKREEVMLIKQRYNMSASDVDYVFFGG